MTTDDMLMPGGQPIGVAGAGRQVREISGGPQEAEELFANLSQGGAVNTPPGYPGKGCQLPGGGWVGLRPKSRSGVPTIDVNIPGMPIRKIKLV